MTVTLQKQPLPLLRVWVLQTSVGDLQIWSIWSLLCLNCRQREGEIQAGYSQHFRVWRWCAYLCAVRLACGFLSLCFLNEPAWLETPGYLHLTVVFLLLRAKWFWKEIVEEGEIMIEILPFTSFPNLNERGIWKTINRKGSNREQEGSGETPRGNGESCSHKSKGLQ